VHSKIKFYSRSELHIDTEAQTSLGIKESEKERYVWKRMSELSMNPSVFSSATKKINPQTTRLGSDRFASPSILSAIISIANHDLMFKTNIFGQIMFPTNNDMPLLNSFGVYGCKLEFNGC
jgi:hypothetical protein